MRNPLLCRLSVHDWHEWDDGSVLGKNRVCKACGERQCYLMGGWFVPPAPETFLTPEQLKDLHDLTNPKRIDLRNLEKP